MKDPPSLSRSLTVSFWKQTTLIGWGGHRFFRLGTCFILVIETLAVLFSSVETTCAQSTVEEAYSQRRIVHRFDFDERKAGNLEDIPKYWSPLRPEGFPHFTYGAFDLKVGHTAPPSFHLSSEGRNVAYQYTGPETRVRANTEYRIEGWIRADRLRTARAVLSAHFLDGDGAVIPGSLVRSPYVGGVADVGQPSSGHPPHRDAANHRDRDHNNADWVRVDMHLSAAPQEAQTIGLEAWVLQEPIWETALLPKRHIFRNDVAGGAWFDDITVYALPRAEVRTSAAGNVLGPADPQVLHVILADADDPSLEGQLSITAADGRLVDTHPILVEMAVDPDSQGAAIPVDRLPPGLYHARLDVFTGDTRILSRTLTFARVGPLYRGPRSRAQSFGVVIDPRARSDPDTELALLDHERVGTVKLPVWSGVNSPEQAARRRPTESRSSLVSAPLGDGADTSEDLRRELVKRGIALVGVFVGPPPEIVRRDGAYVRPLEELLAGDPDLWKDSLAAVVAPNASVFRWWQIGPDGSPADVSQDKLAKAVTRLRGAMRRFISLPRLSIPVSALLISKAGKLPAEQVTVRMEKEIRTASMASVLARFKSAGYDRVSVFIEPWPEERYRRMPRIADWAARIVTARHAGADTVFVGPNWRLRRTPQGRLVEPTELYLIFRTIADVLGDAQPGQRVRIADTVQCLAFHENRSTILAMWDPQAPAGGSRYAVQLGEASRRIDLWGVEKALDRDEHGRQIVELTAMPIFIPKVARWLIDFRTAVSLAPAHVESGDERGRHTIRLVNQTGQAMVGHVELDGPESWELAPGHFDFSLNPHQTGTYAVEVRYPHNVPAGPNEIRAKFQFTQSPYYLEVPLTVEVSVADLQVWGLAVVEGSDLVLRHTVTNRSSSVLSFRGSARVPGRERQYRPLSNLKPGQTQSVEYRFDHGDRLIGRKARLVLREVNDGPRIHNLELIIP